MLKEHYKVYEEKMKKSVEAVERDFGAVRAGPGQRIRPEPHSGGLLRHPHPHPADRCGGVPRSPDAADHPLGRLGPEGH